MNFINRFPCIWKLIYLTGLSVNWTLNRQWNFPGNLHFHWTGLGLFFLIDFYIWSSIFIYFFLPPVSTPGEFISFSRKAQYCIIKTHRDLYPQRKINIKIKININNLITLSSWSAIFSWLSIFSFIRFNISLGNIGLYKKIQTTSIF